MSDSKRVPPADKQPQEQPSTTEKRSGRITFDSRGNAVWEWSLSTGSFGRDIDTKRLEKLTPTDLKIADDSGPPKQAKTFGTAPEQRGPGFDPYNSRSSGGAPPPKKAAFDPYNSTNAPKSGKGKPKDLRKLSEWITKQKNSGKPTK